MQIRSIFFFLIGLQIKIRLYSLLIGEYGLMVLRRMRKVYGW